MFYVYCICFVFVDHPFLFVYLIGSSSDSYQTTGARARSNKLSAKASTKLIMIHSNSHICITVRCVFHMQCTEPKKKQMCALCTIVSVIAPMSTCCFIIMTFQICISRSDSKHTHAHTHTHTHSKRSRERCFHLLMKVSIL